MKRIWPSCNCATCATMRRQAPGATNGSSPSNTRNRASACQKVEPSKGYFFAGAGDAPPRSTLKKSDPFGSTTITSLFLLKLAL